MPASDRDEALIELGSIARERREDAGLSLEEIFERTRVRVEFLRGIEDGDYKGFPDLVYIKGFVRTYLGVIGAEEDLKDEFRSWLNKESPAKDRRIPTNVLGSTTYPTKGFKPASHFWLFAVLFLVLIGSGCYVWYSWANNLVVLPFDQPPREVPAEKEKSADVPLVLSKDSSFLAIVPVSASPPRAEPKPERKEPYLHIKAADTDVWIKVTIAGKVIYTDTLKSGSEVSWDLTGRGQVTYGRANVATVVLNGKELRNASAKGTYFYEPDGTFRKVQ
jgi:cytoskeletal protein RodZ